MRDANEQMRDLARAINDAEDNGLPHQVSPVSRRKTWEESTSDERIERLREVLRTKDLAIQDLRAQLADMAAAFANHRHAANNELLVPYFGRGGFGAIAPLGRYDPLA